MPDVRTIPEAHTEVLCANAIRVEEAVLRDFKKLDLRGGTLIASIPNMGLGAIMLTDHLLESLDMDHIAAFDAIGIPPVALVHQGKARFPVRIHADPNSKIMVLRSEIPIDSDVIPLLAETVVMWAKEHRLRRIITLDAAWTQADDHSGTPPVRYVTDNPDTAEMAQGAGMRPINAGVLAGLSARLMLEGKIQGFEVAGLIAAIQTPEEDAHSALSFSKVMHFFVPKLEIDTEGLKHRLQGMEGALRDIQKAAKDAIERLLSDQGGGPEPEQQYI